MQAMRVGKLQLLLVALVVGVVALAPRAIAALQPGVAYVTGLEMGKGKSALLRISNNSPSRVTYLVNYTAFAEDGNSLANFAEVLVVLDRTIEIDVGEAINARRRAQFPEAKGYEGRFSLIVNGTSVLDPFGPDTVALEAIQQVRKSKYRAAVDWR